MEAPFYRTACARYGIEVASAGEQGRAWIHARYTGELLRGEFRDETRVDFTDRVRQLRAREAIDGVIFGTEWPLLLPAPEIAGVPVLDSTDLHVAAIVERLQESRTPTRE